MTPAVAITLALATVYWFPLRRWMSRWGSGPSDLARVMAGDALILLEFQGLAAGDEIPLGRGPSWPVGVLEPRRALVLDMRNLGSIDWVWQFGLYAIDENRTRLVSRSRVRARTVWARLGTYAIEPAGFVMTRRMLRGLKQRAEALAARPATPKSVPLLGEQHVNP